MEILELLISIRRQVMKYVKGKIVISRKLTGNEITSLFTVR